VARRPPKRARGVIHAHARTVSHWPGDRGLRTWIGSSSGQDSPHTPSPDDSRCPYSRARPQGDMRLRVLPLVSLNQRLPSVAELLWPPSLNGSVVFRAANIMTAKLPTFDRLMNRSCVRSKPWAARGRSRRFTTRFSPAAVREATRGRPQGRGAQETAAREAGGDGHRVPV
jgi:hypothetical protein